VSTAAAAAAAGFVADGQCHCSQLAGLLLVVSNVGSCRTSPNRRCDTRRCDTRRCDARGCDTRCGSSLQHMAAAHDKTSEASMGDEIAP